jgi:hypothetical protein
MRPAGRIAQLVEQRTENPCVRGSIPRPATTSSPLQNPANKGRGSLLIHPSSIEANRAESGSKRDFWQLLATETLKRNIVWIGWGLFLWWNHISLDVLIILGRPCFESGRVRPGKETIDL